MADITMCTNTECPMASSCYRVKAVPSEYQSYFVHMDYGPKGCDMYWPIRPVKPIRKPTLKKEHTVSKIAFSDELAEIENCNTVIYVPIFDEILLTSGNFKTGQKVALQLEDGEGDEITLCNGIIIGQV